MPKQPNTIITISLRLTRIETERVAFRLERAAQEHAKAIEQYNNRTKAMTRLRGHENKMVRRHEIEQTLRDEAECFERVATELRGKL